MKLQADSIIGVVVVSEFDPECEVLTSQAFIESLATVKDGQVIGANISSVQYIKIDKEYGVHHDYGIS